MGGRGAPVSGKGVNNRREVKRYRQIDLTPKTDEISEKVRFHRARAYRQWRHRFNAGADISLFAKAVTWAKPLSVAVFRRADGKQKQEQVRAVSGRSGILLD